MALRGASQQDVGVGAAETERVHSDHRVSGHLDGLRPDGGTEVQLPKVDAGIQGFGVEAGWHRTVPQDQDGLEEAGKAGRRFHVPQVGFHRTQRQRTDRTPDGKRPADGIALDRITDGRSRSVGLQVDQTVRMHRRGVVGPAQQ